MPTSISSTMHTHRAGMCPHGLPHSACPICSGGGRSSNNIRNKAATKPMKMNNQWSWMKCYTVGLAMRADKIRAENAKTAFERQIEFAKELKKDIQQLAERIKAGLENIQKSMPPAIANTIQTIASSVIFPVLNLIAQIPKVIETLAQLQQKITGMLIQAAEKLTAIIGTIKSFFEKNFTGKIKKTLKSIFAFFISGIDDENYRSDDTLSVFKSRELKKLLAKAIKIIRKKKKDAN